MAVSVFICVHLIKVYTSSPYCSGPHAYVDCSFGVSAGAIELYLDSLEYTLACI